MPETQGQLCQERTVPQPTDIIPGNSFRLSPNEGCGHTRACSGHTASCGLLHDRSLSPSQDVSEDAGPHGLCVSSTAAGPASYVAPSALAETEGFIMHLASRTPAGQGKLGLRGSPGPLEMSSVDGTGCALGNGLQEEGGLDRCIQHGLGSSVRGPNDFWPVIERGRKSPHQLPGNAGSVSSPSDLLTRPKGAPRSGPFGQHDGGSLHKSPRRALLEAPLRSSGAPLGMGSAQPAFAESNACARQTEPRCRHAVTEQRPLRGVDAPSAGGSGRSLARQRLTSSPQKTTLIA